MRKNQASGMSTPPGKPLSKVHIDREPPLERSSPAGPFRTVSKQHEGNLLLFVPRNEISRAINDLTGRYGYSHLAIDCGEIDVPSGRRVMIEATMDAGVHYGFQNEYGKRPFVRIPLEKTGMNVERFCDCIHAKVGDKFDDLEAITLGILDNPARQICSDLATICLPQEMREEIARCHRRAAIHPLSAVRDKRLGSGVRLFMSPNGFAEFLSAPHGWELTGPDQLAEPHRQDCDSVGLFEKLWKTGDTLLTGTWRRLRSR